VAGEHSRVIDAERYAGRRPLAWRNWQRTCLVSACVCSLV
jgi:hypothetical protein